VGILVVAVNTTQSAMKRIYLNVIPLATLGLAPVPARAQSSDELKEIDEATRKNQEALKNIPKLNKSKTDKTSRENATNTEELVKENATNTEELVTVQGGNNVSVVVSTPVAIVAILLVGGLALLPLIHVLWKSKHDPEKSDSLLARLTAKWSKPTVLDSDAFIHKRDFDKLTKIVGEIQSLDSDRFSGHEFVSFIKLKSQIGQKKGEYADFDRVIDFMKVAVSTQGSFLKIEQTESRYCSGTQQELYRYTAELLKQNVEPKEFQSSISAKLEEILPQLKTEEGQLALQSYVAELINISNHNLGLAFLAKLKTYQIGEYSILRGISSTINEVDGSTVLDFDSLLTVVLQKADLFTKFGAIVGVQDEYNEPKVYAKMIQYMGLQTRHEAAYEQFQSLLKLLKTWEGHAKTVAEVRNKYDSREYKLPKEFVIKIPGSSFYEKYQQVLKSTDKTTESATDKVPALAR
jgi:hypothetical protein